MNVPEGRLAGEDWAAGLAGLAGPAGLAGDGGLTSAGPYLNPSLSRAAWRDCT